MTIMKLNTLSAILTCAPLLLVHGSSRSAMLESPDDNNDSGRRIMNGQEANPADFPFFVKLFANGALCGGSIISNYWIVTASHCIFKATCQAIEIYPWNWQEGQPPPIHAAECAIHPQYERIRYAFDIALIKTVEDVISGGIESISLPAPGTHYPPDTLGTVVGWGKIGHNELPKNLQRGQSVLVSWDVCNIRYKGSSSSCEVIPDCNVEDIPKRVLCAQGQEPDPQSMCGGDSGGPFIINSELAAINTAAVFTTRPVTKQGCVIGSPTIHTSIVDYLPWIFSFVDPSVNTAEFPVAPESNNTLVMEN
ncbi:chymotrypsin-like elastase family member 3B isoform X2 [Diprion similis]|uniref:chymotrypsin-like elastase family member 3B isoform X2 n=1 Tax=Diprion similis TaxID=362088 RepID=UPI001EF9AACF|nr:chymotrypsin-like elastase family member 3B isoform X2 [Diprion similis]